MGNSMQGLQLGLEDLLGDLQHARRNEDLGRLALLSYCEVRHWARMAGADSLAAQSSALITHGPQANRQAFLAQIDDLIAALEAARAHMATGQAAGARNRGAADPQGASSAA